MEAKSDQESKSRFFKNLCFTLVKAYILSPREVKRHPEIDKKSVDFQDQKKKRERGPKGRPKGPRQSLTGRLSGPGGRWRRLKIKEID